MKQAPLMFILTLIVITLSSQFIASDAQAKRFGGGRSFGSRPSFSKGFNRSSAKRTLSPSQKQAAAKNQNLRNSMNKRGGMMGMLGALAMGGLLGSLLFGGAFENFNLFDIIMIGGLLYLAFRLMSRTQRHATSQPYSRSAYQDADFSPDGRSETQPRSFNTDLMFKNNQAQVVSSPQNSDDMNQTIEIDNFDQASFIEGAKGAFCMLQDAWDSGNQSEIRRMTTDKIFAEIKQQLQDNTSTNHTEIMSLSAEILSARQLVNQLEVQVLFDANIHELPESITSNVQELWHFIQPANSQNSMWFVDGIQQVE